MVFARHLRDIGDEFRREQLDSTDPEDKTELEDWIKMKVAIRRCDTEWEFSISTGHMFVVPGQEYWYVYSRLGVGGVPVVVLWIVFVDYLQIYILFNNNDVKNSIAISF